MRKYGRKIDTRCLNQMRFTLSMISVISETSYESKYNVQVKSVILTGINDQNTKICTPKSILFSFLKSSSDRSLKFQKFTDFYTKSSKIISFCRLKLDIRQQRLEFLDLMWESIIRETTQSLALSKSKTKKINKSVKKIISQLVRILV